MYVALPLHMTYFSLLILYTLTHTLYIRHVEIKALI